ncbi:phosphoethanolamine transferase [Solimonas terrae]|uniref:Phosphoethanolamine transferase n=1 Tax=Solimonas terrae TaxID=1396819 RepID=A0A6M2BST8_9GAMM|nr:phosphoethanolamine transferase [Solimonas terrae]NGY05281.1 phosphoethanolamine transferase [Solimonas terrae]
MSTFRNKKAVTVAGWLLCLLLLIVELLPNAYLFRAAGLSLAETHNPLSALLLALARASPFPAVLLAELLVLALLGRPWLWLLLNLPFLIWLPGELSYLWRYGTPTSAHVFAIIGETNRDEVTGMLGSVVWLCLLGLALWTLALLAVLYFFFRLAPWRHRTRLWTALALGSSLAMTLLVYKRASDAAAAATQESAGSCTGEFCAYTALSPFFYVFVDSYPFGLPVRLYDYVTQRRMLAHYAAVLKDASLGLGRDQALAAQAETYVVVIGESARADHWSLFGYGRPTTPLLDHRDHLLAFGDAVSVTPATRTAVPILLSGASVEDVDAFRFKPSWINAFKAAGFTVSWLSAQLPVGLHDTTVGIYAQLADDIEFLNPGSYESRGSYDDVLLAALDRRLRAPQPKKLIILHMLGSHAPYQHRYPPAYEVFKPAPGTHDDVGINDRDEGDRIDNAYDNSLRYSDHVLDSVITRLNRTAAVSALWYVSDHGQTLPMDGCKNSGNGFFSAYNFHVPLLFWHSTRYDKLFGDRLRAAATNVQRPVYMADFAFSLLDSFGFELPAEQLQRSFMRADYRAGPRIVTIDGSERMDYDRDFKASMCRN